MALLNQTRPLGGRVRCDFLGSPSHSTSTQNDWRLQIVRSRYRLSEPMARQVCSLHFGEAAND